MTQLWRACLQAQAVSLKQSRGVGTLVGKGVAGKYECLLSYVFVMYNY
ncbi:hypothetical protein LMG27177_06217 [Paraburkholderia fynbosensis]|uniref:Uncharacterized protein n=1 Tax=Paraburkholderia fynbosensis TaxID=1200993 RepID=A0A6J5GU19_9BURK|nr:hypothetical protein LMG27177_06217 [Paraburkholderia fynbosensis]